MEVPAPPLAIRLPLTLPRVVRRTDDRRTTFIGLLIAVGFVGLATISFALTALRGGSGWTALHLLLAGAAGTAIASVLPFFTAALAQVAPADRRVRLGAIGLLAGGAVAVTLGVSNGAPWLATPGGCAYLVGLGLVALGAFAPLRARLGRGIGLVPIAYAVALGQVALGVALATAMVAGWTPVVADWAQIKPAHVWLNVFGFLSVIVAATLIHLAPTVAGTRIRRRRSATIALVSMMAAPPLVAMGFIGGWDALARLSVLLELGGAAALVAQAAAVQRDRGRWTSDREWHRFTSLSLLAAPIWFLVATSIVAARVVWLGAAPSAWSVTVVGVPLALGWVAQVLIGSWTHLVPAIGPGDQAAHAAQRRRLGRWGTTRVALWDGGVAAMTVGLLAGYGPLTVAGAVVLGICIVMALGLLAGSIPRGPVVPARRTVTDHS